MKIQVFAGLKDHFEKEFVVTEPIENVAALKALLINKNQKAEKLVNLCRFAVGNEFVDLNYSLNQNDVISIIPPSSGG